MLYASVLQQGGQRSIARAVAGNRDRPDHIAFTGLLALLCAGLVGVGLALLASFLGSMQADYGINKVLLSAAIIPAMLCLTLGQGFLLGSNDFASLNRSAVYSKLLIFSTTAALIAAGFGVTGALVGLIAGLGGTGLVVLIRLSRVWHLIASPRGLFTHAQTSPSLLKRILSFGLIFSVAQLFMQLNLRLDIFVLSLLRAPAEVGLYAVATNVSELLLVVPAAIGAVLFGRSAAQANDSVRMQQVTRAVRLAFTLAVAAAGGLAVASPLLVPLIFGAEYAGSTSMLFVLVPGVLALGMFKVLYGEVAGGGVPGSAIIMLVLGSFLNVALNFALVPTYGAVGAAYASTISYIAIGVSMYAHCLLRWNVGLLDLLVPRPEDFVYARSKLKALVHR